MTFIFTAFLVTTSTISDPKHSVTTKVIVDMTRKTDQVVDFYKLLYVVNIALIGNDHFVISSEALTLKKLHNL